MVKLIQFETNFGINSRIGGLYGEGSKPVPKEIANSSFQLVYTSVEGYGLYRNTDYHIELYSNKTGGRSNFLEVFIYDLHSETKRFSSKLSCNLKVETIEE